MTSKKESQKQNDIDFEIQFIEGILKDRPSFVEALIVLGDLYTKKGLYEQGLKVDERLAKLRPRDASILYNLACSYSLVNDIEKSLAAIKSAVEFGYDNFSFLEHDSDLHNLRQDGRFKEFFSQIKKEIANTP